LRTCSLGLLTSEDLAKQFRNSQGTAENVPDKEPKQKAHSLKKSQKVGKQLYSTTSSPSLRNPGQDRQPHPISSRTSSSSPKSPLHITGENPKEKEEKPGKTLRETDSLKTWDALGFSFTLGGKDKSRGRDKVRKGQCELCRILPVSHHSSKSTMRKRNVFRE